MEIIQLNKFSDLHDGENIIFCKTDFLLQEFERIKTIKNKVVLISGNSDYCITDQLVSLAPPNIKKWFCQNKYSDSRLLQSIPIGLDNSKECKREGHGVAWDHAKEKYEILSNPPLKDPTRLVFANFTVGTNPGHRSQLKRKAVELSHITWKEPFIEFSEYVDDIIDHEAVLCAQGNGDGDNHRIYESLYLSRVPLTFNPTQYRYIHYLFPTVLISKPEELDNETELRKKIERAKEKTNKKYLDFDYWKDMILECAKSGR